MQASLGRQSAAGATARPARANGGKRSIFGLRWNVGIGGLLLAAAVLVAYLPAIRGGFIWDDNLLITENPLITAAGGPGAIWMSRNSMDYTPLTLTTFWVEWRLWGGSPIGFHLVNLLLHAAAAFLIWRTLEKLEIPGGWLAALIFAIHPVNVASVAWIAERKNTLSLFFYMLALFWFLDFQRERARRVYALAFIAAACAFLSKGSTVILPAVMLGCVWWREKKLTRADLVLTGPFFALGAVFAWVTVHYQAQIVNAERARAPAAFRIVRAGDAVWFYLWKDLLPLHLCPIYPRWAILPGSPGAWLPALLAVGCGGLFWWQRERWGRGMLFAWGYFLLALLPVLGFLDMGFMDQAHVADWWQEIAMIGPAALAGAGLALGFRRAGRNGRAALALAAAAALIWLAWRTSSEAANYKSAEVYWRHALALNPGSWEAHDNFGNALSLEGRLDEAIAQYREALRLTQAYPTSFYNLGNALRRQGDFAEAIPNYQQALRLRPAYPEAHINLGVALKEAGQIDEAISQYREALRIDPDSAEAHDNLGVALQAEGKMDEAIAEYREALRIKPENGVARRNLAGALGARGSLEDAMLKARQILKAHANDAETYEDVADELQQRGLYAEAAGIFDEGIALHGTDAHLLANFAWLLATCPEAAVRNGARAVGLASQAVQLNRTDAAVVNPLAAAYAEAGRFPEALATAREALRLAQKSSDKDLADLIRKEIANFSKGQAFTYR